MAYRNNRTDQQREARRIQRRLWFGLHVAALALANLFYTPDPLLLSVKSLLLSTVFIHFYWLYVVGIYETTMQAVTERAYAALEDMSAQSLPLLGDGQCQMTPQRQTSDFWYRWHDV